MSGAVAAMTSRETCSINRACTLVGVSRRTIYNWLEQNKIEAIRTAGGQQRIYVDTLWRTDKPVAPSEKPTQS